MPIDGAGPAKPSNGHQGAKVGVVRRQYDQLAARYDSRWARYVSSTLAWLVESLSLTGRERILDVGCGTGEMERLLLARYPNLRLTGVDLSPEMLAVARAKLAGAGDLTFLNGEANRLPVADGAFDLVISASAFHYFPDPVGVLREMARVLAPVGRMVIMDWCRDYWLCALYDVVLGRIDPAHHSCHSVKMMNGFVETAGLDLTSVRRFRTAGFWGMMRHEIRLPPAPA